MIAFLFRVNFPASKEAGYNESQIGENQEKQA
jgi:hypothetical protein